MTHSPIRVLLVDDHAIVREGYRRLLEASGLIDVCAEAADGEQAYRIFCERTFDVVVLDITLPGIGGLEVMRRMLARDAACRVLVFSMHEEPVFSLRALQAGARGYITKSSAPEILVEAVLTVCKGHRYLGQDVAQSLAKHSRIANDDNLALLTEREFEVFRLLATGSSLSEIAAILSLTGKTVANYQSIIKQKLGVESSMQLLRIAIEHGMIGGDWAK